MFFANKIYRDGTTNKVSDKRDQRAEKHRRADRLPALGAGAAGDHQWYRAADAVHKLVINTGRKRIVADSITASTYSTPAIAQLIGELDNENAVLAGDADQHDGADLTEHVDR